MFNLIAKIFCKKSSSFIPKIYNDERDLVSFVRYVTECLVDHPDSIEIESKIKNNNLNINVKCRKKDIGKLIGKHGKTIGAIRALVSGAGSRVGKSVRIEIVE